MTATDGSGHQVNFMGDDVAALVDDYLTPTFTANGFSVAHDGIPYTTIDSFSEATTPASLTTAIEQSRHLIVHARDECPNSAILLVGQSEGAAILHQMALTPHRCRVPGHSRRACVGPPAFSLGTLASLVVGEDPDLAVRHLRTAFAAFRDAGDRSNVIYALEGAARLHAVLGHDETAVQLGSACRSLRQRIGVSGVPAWDAY